MGEAGLIERVESSGYGLGERLGLVSEESIGFMWCGLLEVFKVGPIEGVNRSE